MLDILLLLPVRNASRSLQASSLTGHTSSLLMRSVDLALNDTYMDMHLSVLRGL